MTESSLLIDFKTASADDWQIVNDGVMGGRSRGSVDVANGALSFTGELVTQGGGFTSVRTFGEYDLSDYTGLELRVRGNGRTFEVEINDRWRIGGRPVSRRAPFDTGEEWTIVRVPFEALRATSRGRSIEVAPLQLANVRRLGFFILDGQDGPFRLEVSRISAFR